MRDLRYAIRMLLRSPGFTAAALLCLALGSGATTAIFSVVNAVVLRPLAYRDPNTLVRLYTEFPTFPGGGLRRFWVSPPEWLDLRRETQSWEAIEGYVTGGANITGANEPVRIQAASITGGLLPMLGVSPIKGRLLSPQDDTPEAPFTAVLSYGAWQRLFGGDPQITSREIRLNGRLCHIVGVMPSGFQFPPGEADPAEIWAPLQINPANPGGRGRHFLSLIGRLKPAVPLAQARQELDRVTQAFGAKASPNTHLFHPTNHPLVSYPLHEETIGAVRPAMLALLAAVGFVLLIACVNVANLLLARAEARQREISIRTAMGANTALLLRQFLTEGVLLSLSGALLGLGFAFLSLRLIAVFQSGSIPRAAEITMDWRVLLFTLSVSLLTGILFGLAPLLHRFSSTIAEALKATGGRTTATVQANRWRAFLVASELALALVLLIGAGLMTRAFWRLQSTDIGLRTENLLTLRLALPQQAFPDNKRVTAFWEQLLERTNSLPGVAAASMASGLPPVRPLNANDTQIEGFVQTPGGPLQNVDFYQTAGDRFLETTGARLIEGRVFGPQDGASAPPVVVINQTMARTFWPDTSPLGRRVRPSFDGPWRTIVGVVADVKNAAVDKPAGTELFLPFRQTEGFGTRNGVLLVRTQGDPSALVSTIRQTIAAIEPNLPVSQIRTMDTVVETATARPRFLTLLLTLFSSVALVLAALGIYGVMSYLVAQRTSEFGIRMAIGANAGHVLWLVLRHGLLLAIAGVAAGAIGAALLTRSLKGTIFGIDTIEPLTFLAMAATLVAAVVFACLFPARRATQVDPMVALRCD